MTSGEATRCESVGPGRGRLGALKSRSYNRSDYFFLAVTTIATGFAAVANFVRLSVPSMLPDEPVYLHAGWIYLHGDTHPAIRLPSGRWRVSFPDNYEHPPLAKYLFGLAQLVQGRPTVHADRMVAALCTMLAGAVVFWWLGRAANRWAGLLGALLVTTLPEHGLLTDSYSRYGILEPVASFFAIGSVALAWWWFHSKPGFRSWLWAVATGVAVALAASAKETGFLGVLGPVILGLVLCRRESGLLIYRAAQSAVAAVVAGVVFLGLYLPIGPPGSLIAYMIDYQNRHLAEGHLVQVAGTIYRFPPWWSTLWFVFHGLGAVLALTLLGLSAVALVLRRDRLTAWLAAALVGPIIFLCFVSTISLESYWTLWAPAFYCLAALGAVELFRRATVATWPGRTAGVALVAAIAVIGISVGQEVAAVTRLKPAGAEMVAATTERLGLTGPGIDVGIPLVILREYIDQKRLLLTLPASLQSVEFVAVGNTTIPRTIDPGVMALVALNRQNGSLIEVYSDQYVTVYRVAKPLTRPSVLQIEEQRLTDALPGRGPSG